MQRARQGSDSQARRLIAAASTAALLGGVGFGGAPGSAVQICGERDALLEQFAQQDDEKLQALGLGSDGGVIEVLVAAAGGWTMLVNYPERPTCVVAMGEAWGVLLAGNAT